MIRASLLTFAMLTLPATAVAQCGSSTASFTVSCEKGVQVYRHKAPSALPQQRSIIPKPSLEIEKRRLEIAEERLAMERQAQAEQAETRRREMRAEDYRRRVIAQRRIDRVRGYGPAPGFGFGFFGGYTLAQPIRVPSAN